jgi:hypothetical protein
MIELKILTNTYKDVVIEDEVHEVIDKQNIVVRKLVEEKDITSVQEVLNGRGKPYKTRCMVHIANEGHMIVKHKYEELKQIKNGEQRIGY